MSKFYRGNEGNFYKLCDGHKELAVFANGLNEYEIFDGYSYYCRKYKVDKFTLLDKDGRVAAKANNLGLEVPGDPFFEWFGSALEEFTSAPLAL